MPAPHEFMSAKRHCSKQLLALAATSRCSKDVTEAWSWRRQEASQSLLRESPRRWRKSVTGHEGEGGEKLSATSMKSSSSEISTGTAGKCGCGCGCGRGRGWGWSWSCSSSSVSESSLRRRTGISAGEDNGNF